MLDTPSQYMHYCLILFCEVYCVIVQGTGIIVVFFVTELETCYWLGIWCTSPKKWWALIKLIVVFSFFFESMPILFHCLFSIKRQRQRHQTEGLMNRIRTVHIRYKSYISTFLCRPLHTNNAKWLTSQSQYLFWRKGRRAACISYLQLKLVAVVTYLAWARSGTLNRTNLDNIMAKFF